MLGYSLWLTLVTWALAAFQASLITSLQITLPYLYHDVSGSKGPLLLYTLLLLASCLLW